MHRFYHSLSITLRRAGRFAWLDRTRVSSGAYGALSLVILAAFDDGRLYGRTPCLALAALLMVAGARDYIRSHRPIVKVTALLRGMSLASVVGLLDQPADLHRIDLAQAA